MARCNFVASCLFGYLTLNQVFMLTVPDPCPSGIDPSTLGDMCSDKTARELDLNNNETNHIFNSVGLRVTTQMSNCKCRLSLEYHVEQYTVYMRKYNMLPSSAPVDNNCGLAIDVDYPFMPGIGDDGTRPPIECTTGLDLHKIALDIGSSINFTSRIINGSFTRGYCVQIFRQYLDGDIPTLRLTCENSLPLASSSTSVANDPEASSTPSQIATTLKSEKEITTTMSEITSTTETKPYKPSTMEMSSAIITDSIETSKPHTTTSFEYSEHTTRQTSTNDFQENRTHQTTLSGTIESQSSTDLQKGNMFYIIIGACSGFVIILVTTITTIICKRKTSLSKKNKSASNRFKNDNRESDVVDDGLKDNVLYVSAEEDVHLSPNNSSMNYDGNYSVVDLNGHLLTDNKDISILTYSSVRGEESQDNNSKFLLKSTVDSNLAFVSDNDANSNRITKQEKPPSDVYAVVDKSSKVGKTNCPETGIKTAPLEQTYAVVDKLKKR